VAYCDFFHYKSLFSVPEINRPDELTR
jgi:hypothetical protein